MKKSIRRTIDSLRKYIGYEVIRTHPVNDDWSYTSDEPILLTGFTPDGRIKYVHTGTDKFIFGSKEYILPISFTDRNWITYKKALNPRNNTLNKWIGKEIIMTHPEPMTGDCSFTHKESPVTLISASRYHITIMYNDGLLKGKKSTLDSKFNNPSDWKLA